MLCFSLSSMPNWKSLFLFVLQQFLWWVTENTGLLLFFVPPFLSFNMWQLYLWENVLFFFFGVLLYYGKLSGRNAGAFYLQLLLLPSLPVPFLSHPSHCSTMLGPKWCPLKVTLTFVGLCGNTLLHVEILRLQHERVESTITDKSYVHE